MSEAQETVNPVVEEGDGFWDDKLNLVGHCAICFGTVSPSISSRRDVEEMDHLWPYLQEEWKEEYVSNYVFVVERGRQGREELINSKVPPLCSMCRDSLKILDKLHQEMLTIQRKIETQASAIRRMMGSNSKFEKGFLKFARDLKLAALPLRCTSNTVEFLSRLHGRSSEELEKLFSSVDLNYEQKNEEARRAKTFTPKGKKQSQKDPLDTFYDESSDFPSFSPHSPAASSSSFQDESNENETEGNSKKKRSSSSNEPLIIKAEPDSDDEGVDNADMLDFDDPNFNPSDSEEATPKSRKAKRSPVKTSKSRKRKKTSDSDSDPDFDLGDELKKVKVKKEVLSDKDYVSNEDDVEEEEEEEDEGDSDWSGKQKKMKRAKSSPTSSSTPAQKTESTSESGFKYRTHSRKKCEVCMEKLPLAVLFEHLQSHVKDYAVKCKNCGHSFLSKHRLEVYHYQKWPKCRMAAGFPPPPWTKTCERCDFSSDSHVTMRSHLQKHEVPSEKNFTCPFENCGESFTLRCNVEFHLEKHYNQGSSSAATQRCPVCAKCIAYDAQVDMKTHLKKVHKLKEIFPCKGCPQVYHKREALIKHIFPLHIKEGILCDICEGDDTRYFKEYHLREHYFTAHHYGDRQACEICDYVSYGRKQYMKHRWYKHRNGEIAVPLKTFRCEICTDKVYEYKSKDALTTHNIKLHGAEPHKCKICGETFETKNKWWRHERQHSGPLQPRYKCEYCQKPYDHANKLKDHVDRVHLKVFANSFKCDMCDKSYSDVCGLKYHKSSVHFGIKYVCEECGHSFATPMALKSHQRRHTGERPYKCHLCPNSFRQADAYKRHLFCHETLGDKFRPKKTNDRKIRKEETVEPKPSENNDAINPSSTPLETEGTGTGGEAQPQTSVASLNENS